MNRMTMWRSANVGAIAIMSMLMWCQAGRADESSALAIDGCAVFPADNIWNVPVDSLPVDPSSNLYVNTIGAGANVHADFGSGIWPPDTGGPIGIPYVSVNSLQGKVTVSFDYAGESDLGPYPIPPNPPIEFGSDHHILILERDNCILYELYNARLVVGQWYAGSGAIYDLKVNGPLRPAGWTSADAAGLPMLPGLVRYAEVASGEIRHAVRFTVPQTRRAYIWPARHHASSLTDPKYPPMGQRFRLKASFNTSGFSHDARVIAEALKKYGMILADNGAPWYISGAPDERWNNDVLHELDVIQGSDFEAVNVSSLMIDPNSGQARTGGGGHEQRRLTVAVAGSGRVTSAPGGIDCPGDCTEDFELGTPVALLAQPEGGWDFGHWEGDSSGSDPNCVIPMNADRSATAVFVPNPSQAWIKVVSPNGGESWTRRSKRTIRWTSGSITGNVAIQISTNGGARWRSIVAQTANDGIHKWTVSVKRTNNALVRVSSVDNPDVRDTSDSVFKIK